MAVRSALQAGRPLHPGRFLVLISVRGWVDFRANNNNNNMLLLLLLLRPSLWGTPALRVPDWHIRRSVLFNVCFSCINYHFGRYASAPDVCRDGAQTVSLKHILNGAFLIIIIFKINIHIHFFSLHHGWRDCTNCTVLVQTIYLALCYLWFVCLCFVLFDLLYKRH
jgi:hypothetical protein